MSRGDNSSLRGSAWTAPLLFPDSDQQTVEEQLRKDGYEIWSIHDQMEIALSELFEIYHPEQKDNIDKEQKQKFIAKHGQGYGVWVYYPWNGELIRFPEPNDYHLLRTARNRNLITSEEQLQLRNATVLIAGMSVGSNVAETMAYQATAGKLILADMDHLEPTNLNRIRAVYRDIGEHKVDVVARRISELDPFIAQEHLYGGIDAESVDEGLDGDQIDIIVDEVDDLLVKVRLREFAIKHKIPVVMATDDGEDVLIDIERYDLETEPKILHGLIPDEMMNRLKSGDHIPRAEMGMVIGKYFVGFENVPLRMLESLGEVGKTIPAWPQLGTAATLAGVVATYCVKQIILDHDLPSGRAVIGPEQSLNPHINSDQYQQQKQQLLDKIMP